MRCFFLSSMYVLYTFAGPIIDGTYMLNLACNFLSILSCCSIFADSSSNLINTPVFVNDNVLLPIGL